MVDGCGDRPLQTGKEPREPCHVVTHVWKKVRSRTGFEQRLFVAASIDAVNEAFRPRS